MKENKIEQIKKVLESCVILIHMVALNRKDYNKSIDIITFAITDDRSSGRDTGAMPDPECEEKEITILPASYFINRLKVDSYKSFILTIPGMLGLMFSCYLIDLDRRFYISGCIEREGAKVFKEEYLLERIDANSQRTKLIFISDYK